MIALLPQGSLVQLPFPSRQRVDSWVPSYHFAYGFHEALLWNRGKGVCARSDTGTASTHQLWFLCPELHSLPSAGHMEHPYTPPTFNLPPYSYCSSFLRLCFLSYKELFMFKHGKEYILCRHALPCREGPSKIKDGCFVKWGRPTLE